MDNAIEIRGLTKTYRTRHGRHTAVDQLSMDVPLGGVHGFLGPNGAGKTTTLRIIAGLARANSGSVRILGRTMPRRLSKVIGRMGIIVESPHFQEAFSGRLNLELLARSIGVRKKRVDEVLAETRLTDRADDRVKAYSLGMKQRLSIAAAMLKNPDIYIFDEPTNGLDPQGIREIRRTIHDLGATGHTVLVSSHILSEVEQFADTVTIIGRGHVIAEGSVDELRWGQSPVLEVGVSDLSQGASLLRQLGLRVRTRDYLLLVDNPPPAERVAKHLAVHGLYVTHLSLQRSSLEDAYFELTESAAFGGAGEPRDSGPELRLDHNDRDLWRPAEVDIPVPVARAENPAKLDLSWLDAASDSLRTDTVRRSDLGAGLGELQLGDFGPARGEPRADGFGADSRVGELPRLGTGELPRLSGTGELPLYDETLRTGGIPLLGGLSVPRDGGLYPAGDLGAQHRDTGESLRQEAPARPGSPPPPPAPPPPPTPPPQAGLGEVFRPGDPAPAYRPSDPGSSYRPGGPAPVYRPSDSGSSFRPGDPAPAYQPSDPGAARRPSDFGPAQPGTPRPGLGEVFRADPGPARPETPVGLTLPGEPIPGRPGGLTLPDVGTQRPAEPSRSSDFGSARPDPGPVGLGGGGLPDPSSPERSVRHDERRSGGFLDSGPQASPGAGLSFGDDDTSLIPRRGDTGQFPRYQGDDVPRRARRALPDPEENAE